MTETPNTLRENLQALRLERRDGARQPSRRRWIVVAILVAVGALVVFGSILRGGAPVPVETARAAPVTAEAGKPAAVAVLSGSGYVVSADRYISIGVRVPGRIDRYFVEEGAHVKAGDALVELDARDYKATVARLEATLASAKAQAVLKTKQHSRARTLAGSKVMSRDELDIREADSHAADAAVKQAEAELETARVNLEYTTLRAPRGGVILAKLKEVGEIAVPGGFSGSGDLIRMANLDDLRGQVDITESELAKVRMNQRADVTPDAYPDHKYPAHVVKLYPQVDRQKGTLRVEVQIETPDEFLWPDMSARITFLDEAETPSGTTTAILVPQSAIRSDDAGTFVWVVRDARAQRVGIATGKDFGEQIQVTSGLTGDETVVVGTPPPLKDGQAVAKKS
jgi:RND family efflux transporter MFP subunit